MKKDEALQIPDLCIEVTPLIEDAFFAFRDIDCKELDKRLNALGDDYVSGDAETDALLAKYLNDLETADKARERFMQGEPKERVHAMATAFQMMENIEKYGVPCAEWIAT